eukprot:Phypoly_transcript_01829.p1 GENE.Phypoly_transcript_01829~~Phypoly_transcript_01829.p1  ORF type:complete len:904 (+),score=160.18 Phypoly_transcript_01829:247-2958(+)
MSTLTKLAYDKTIMEMHNTIRMQNKRMELGSESPSLRTSSAGILFNDTSSDSESDASSSGSGSYSTSGGSYSTSAGSYGSVGRHSYINISEESSPSSSMSASYAFMTSARGSRILQEEEIAKLADMPMDSTSPGGESPVDQRISVLTADRSIRSPTIVKDKRMEFLAKIKNDIITNNTFSQPGTPPPSSPPDGDEPSGHKRVHRHSFIQLGGSGEGIKPKDSDPEDKLKDKDKEKEEKAKLKKEGKEKLKEEKLRRKLEKKELKKAKAMTDPPTILSSENSKIMQQLLGAMRPRATLSHRAGADLEEQLRRPIDSSGTVEKGENALRRSTSFSKDLEPTNDEITWRNQNRPKYEKILGTVPDIPEFLPKPSEERPNWRKTKFVKSVLSDPSPVTGAPQSSPSMSIFPSLPAPYGIPSPTSSLSSTPPLPPTPPLPRALPSVEETDQEAKLQRRTPKIYQILGENPSLATVIDVSTIDTAPANTSIEMDVDEEGIVFADVREQSGRRQVKGATLKKLVERLTDPQVSDPTFLLQFIITYRSFTNPHELLELLKVRYESGIEVNPEASDAEKEALAQKQLIVRLRVYNVIRHWIDKQWMDFLEDQTLVEKLLSYATTINEVVSSKSSAIDKLMEKKMAEGEKQKKIMFNMSPPDSHIPTVPKDKWKLLDIHPEEIARQMTLMEYTLFKAIKPWEYLCWNTKMKQTKSANILSMINKFNVMSKWVQTEVLSGRESAKQRAITIGRFLEICEHLRALKNYNGIMEILSGLNASAVHRLKLTWACLSAKQNEVFQDFNAFTTGKNYANLRTALHTLQPPCIPYLGMYLTDLTFINDGIPLYLPETCLINFDKCRKVSASVLEIMQYQQTPFCLHPVEDIQSYLSQLETKCTQTDDELYKLSLVLEERK